jgi:division protein CdvB (Snf7/Vps24/ESCRT-III family)
MWELFGPMALSIETCLDDLYWANTYLQKLVIALHDRLEKVDWILKMVYNRIDLIQVRMGTHSTGPMTGALTPLDQIIDLDVHTKANAHLS